MGKADKGAGPRARSTEPYPTARTGIVSVVQVAVSLARPPLPLPTKYTTASSPPSPASSARSTRIDTAGAQRARSSSVGLQLRRPVPVGDALLQGGFEAGPGGKRKSAALMDEIAVDGGTPVRTLAIPSSSNISPPPAVTPKRLALPDATPLGSLGPEDEVRDVDMDAATKAIVPAGSLGPQGAAACVSSSSSSAAAAAQAEVKVRVQTCPALERHVERLESHCAALEKRNSELQIALDRKMQENVENYQAALAASDVQVLTGLEGGRRMHEYRQRIVEFREAGVELQQQLHESRQEATEAIFAVAARDRQARELSDAFTASHNSEAEMLARTGPAHFPSQPLPAARPGG